MSGTPCESDQPARVEVQGHRGARGHSPENTIAGFAAALELGVDTLELDLLMSRDGELMVHHDLCLNPDTTRDTHGHWIEYAVPLIELDASAIGKLDVGRLRPGSGYQRRFPDQQAVDGERIPRLDALFTWIRRCGHERIGFNIEVKSNPEKPGLCALPVHVAIALKNVLEASNMSERVVVQSFDWRIQRELKRLMPALPTSYLSTQQTHWDTIQAGTPGASAWTADWDVHACGGCVASAVKAAGGQIWSPDHRDLSASSVRAARALGLRVWTWTVNEYTDIRRALDFGVHGIISDYPDRVRAALLERGMPIPGRSQP